VKSSEEGKFGSKTYKGPEKNLSKDMSLSDFNKDSEQSFGPGKPAEQDMIGTAIIVDGTKDHWIVSKRIGKYQVLEGAGVNGGEWAAKGPGDFEKFKTKAQAIEHSEVSQSNENWPD
jgi:hypothetical protein